jgi:EpsI family protein
MLSVAYGRNQSDALQAHDPEVCYPAQGFQVMSRSTAELRTDFGAIPTRRLETVLQGRRHEPVTYWLTLGNQVTTSRLDKKLKEVKWSVDGYIPDGLLFRVSSLGDDKELAYSLHEQFVRDLAKAVSDRARQQVFGLPR